MQFDATTINMLVKGIWETIYMVFLSSALSYVIGIPLGIALVVTDREGISPVPLFNKVLGLIINLLRSVPFIILLIMVLPITKFIVGKTIGSSQIHGCIHLADYSQGTAAGGQAVSVGGSGHIRDHNSRVLCHGRIYRRRRTGRYRHPLRIPPLPDRYDDGDRSASGHYCAADPGGRHAHVQKE